jgi:hypothetical protein
MYDRKVMLRLFWSIVVIILLCIMSLMVGCTSRTKDKEINVYNVDSLSSTDYSIYIIDSCEYIIFYSGSSTWGSHKGNCKNPKHVH